MNRARRSAGATPAATAAERPRPCTGQTAGGGLTGGIHRVAIRPVWTQTEVQSRNRRAFDYIERVRRARRDNCRWWDTLVQRALACGVGAFVLALLVVLWVTR